MPTSSYYLYATDGKAYRLINTPSLLAFSNAGTACDSETDYLNGQDATLASFSTIEDAQAFITDYFDSSNNDATMLAGASSQ